MQIATVKMYVKLYIFYGIFLFHISKIIALLFFNDWLCFITHLFTIAIIATLVKFYSIFKYYPISDTSGCLEKEKNGSVLSNCLELA